MNLPVSSGPFVEHVVRMPKIREKFHIMKFNASLKVDVSKWEQADIVRENNLKEYIPDDDMPKFGAGSEFGRELKEEARRKKYGIITKHYNPADQPWILNVALKGTKVNKKYKGLREGGITENASYYIFAPAADGSFEAYPVAEWYNFTPMVNYKHLSAEEAEEEFGRRDKVLNYFSIMVKKRLKTEDSGVHDEGEEGDNKKKKGKAKKKNSDLLITEDEEWAESSEDDDDEDEPGKGDEKDKKKNKATKKGKKETKKKKKPVSDDEAEEDSDDGDDEGREVDYMSDSSSSGSEHPDDKVKEQLKGVEDEPALKKLDHSDSEDEEEEKKDNENENNGDHKGNKEDKRQSKKEGGPKAVKNKTETGDASSESSSDSEDSDDFDNDNSFQSAMFMQQPKRKHGGGRKGSASNSENNSAASSRAATPTQASKDAKATLKQAVKALTDTRTGTKRKMAPELSASAKRPCITPSPSSSSLPSSQSSNSANDTITITEENVYRYLQRKPMTTTELLQKFKSKKTGLNSDQMVTTLAQILKRINPEKNIIKGKMYLSLGKSE